MKTVKIDFFEKYVGKDRVEVTNVATDVVLFIWHSASRTVGAFRVFSIEGGAVEDKVSYNPKSILKELIEEMKQSSDDASSFKIQLRAKLIGGSDVAGLKIGKRIAEGLVKLLHEEGIPIGGYDTGGSITRKIIFNPVRGEAIVTYRTGGTIIV